MCADLVRFSSTEETLGRTIKPSSWFTPICTPIAFLPSPDLLAITSAGSSLTPLSTSPTSSTSSTRLAVVSAQLPPVNEAGCFCDDIQCTIALSPPNGSRVELTHIQLTDHEMATVDDRVDS
ncbi:hypothetical protein TcWFU_004480 [Taenia crassiceps]|uniref:Uncharacterized protein n=1 Tax=Taenia crassiceps TaxID=6207 RepID=A0ABR4QDD8_9CEST